MSEEEFRQKLSKIQAQIATKNAMVMADPLRYLNDMSQHCSDLLNVLDKIEYALSPDIVFDIAMDSSIKPQDINGEAYIRCTAALKIIREYKT